MLSGKLVSNMLFNKRRFSFNFGTTLGTVSMVLRPMSRRYNSVHLARLCGRSVKLLQSHI
jgi:hypothetical protein